MMRSKPLVAASLGAAALAASLYVLVSAAASMIFAVGISSAASPAPAANPAPANDADPFPITVRLLPGAILVGTQGAGAAGGPGSALTISGAPMPPGDRAIAL